MNLAFAENSAFKKIDHLDFRLNTDFKLHKVLPSFEAIPIEIIGLFIDEYRSLLPTEGGSSIVTARHPSGRRLQL